jgi:hypothetical protein
VVTKFQFETVYKLLEGGADNYVQIRQQAGLTSAELDEIMNNLEYYKDYFERQDKFAKTNEKPVKKHWWQR